MDEKKHRKTGNGNGEHSPILDMIRELPTVKAPPHFEPLLYKRLGITFMPFHRKVLIMGALSAFAGSVYFAGRYLFGKMLERLTLASVTQSFSIVYTKVMQAVSIIKVGYHLKEILLAFANPWFFVGVAFVSSGLLLILIAIVKNGKRKAVLLSNH